MSGIKAVTIHKIAVEHGILRKYTVEYCTGIVRTYGIPPDTVENFINENSRDFSKVKYKFTAGS